MRILYAINSAKFGGAERHTLDLVTGMYNRGHEIYVWCPDGEYVEKFKKAGAQVVVVKIGFDIDPLYIFALIKYLKNKKIDIIHAHELKVVGNALIAGFLAGTKVRVSHTHTPISEWRISKLRKFINIKLFYSPFVNLFATREIALTPSRKGVKIREGISESKLEIIPNGLDLQEFSISKEDRLDSREEIFLRYGIPFEAFVFGALGRLSEEKGIDVLIEAFSIFRDRYHKGSEVYLLVGGGGELNEKLQEAIKDAKMSDYATVTGERYTDEDKIKFYSSFDTFCFPSLAEGFGIVLMEAMALGIPSLASDLEVLQEVGGSTVMFFESGNPENLAEKMYNVYSKRNKLKSLGEASRKRVMDLYTMKNFVDLYERLYVELLESAK